MPFNPRMQGLHSLLSPSSDVDQGRVEAFKPKLAFWLSVGGKNVERKRKLPFHSIRPWWVRRAPIDEHSAGAPAHLLLFFFSNSQTVVFCITNRIVESREDVALACQPGRSNHRSDKRVSFARKSITLFSLFSLFLNYFLFNICFCTHVHTYHISTSHRSQLTSTTRDRTLR